MSGPPSDQRAGVAFLMRVAELLHTYGTPAFRLERVLQKMAHDVGVEASFLSTPTAVMASVGTGSERVVHLIRSDSGEVDLGKLVEFDETMDRVRDRELTPEEGLARLEEIAASGSRYPEWGSALAFGLASAGAAVFFHGGPLEVLWTFLLSLGTFSLARLSPGGHDAVGVFEPLAAFLTASLAAAGAFWFGLDARIVTLAGLIVLVPGLTLTVGMIELAMRHLVSGMARLAGAGAVFLMLLVGAALGWRVAALIAGVDAGLGSASLPVRTTAELAPGWVWAAVLSAPFAFAVVLGARRSEFGVIFAASVLGYLAARFGAATLGADLGPFLGALVVGLVANAYARLVDRPALVPLTPGIFMLVPGSLGFRSLTSFLDADSAAGTEWAFRTGLVAISLVAGLLLANLILRPRRVL